MTCTLTENQKKACVVLSQLFLDNELSSTDIDLISTSLRSLSLSVEKLDAIFRDDLFPVLYPNLLSTAGLWTEFDEKWLIDQVQRNRAGSRGVFASIGSSVAWILVRGAMRPAWSQVKERLTNLELQD